MSDGGYQKHSVTTDALDTLGTIIGEGEKRDAIHLAVEPVVASERLRPGEALNFTADGLAQRGGTNPIGIVDPFLTRDVEAGERFWLVVMPRQITSLRHVWEHPSFPLSGETGVAVAAPGSAPTIDRAESERYLRQYVDPDYMTLDDFANACATDRWDGVIVAQGHDEHGLVPGEFWIHLANYLRRPVTPRAEYFSCHC